MLLHTEELTGIRRGKNRTEHSLNPNVENNPFSCGRYNSAGSWLGSDTTLWQDTPDLLGLASQTKPLYSGSLRLPQENTFVSLAVGVFQNMTPKDKRKSLLPMEITVDYLPFLGYLRFVKIMGQVLEHVCVCTILQLTNNLFGDT